ncbi:MAG: single-stranded DNA-binding protein [Proteobacteria bacterium]|nr:single-stranded DNA-binding protein [Pseudomonadota bacterium]
MSYSVNKVILVGHLGNAPEQRTMTNGHAVTSFRLATSKEWRDRESGERQEHTEWHSIVCYRNTAEFVSQYIAKGRQVYIEGELRTRKFQDKSTGTDRYMTEVVADSVVPLGARPEQDGKAPAGKQGKGQQERPAEPPMDDDDLPY